VLGAKGGLISIELVGFAATEERMLHAALDVLRDAGYDVSVLKELIHADLPPGIRGMSWPNGAVLGQEAFSSQMLLNHVLEEELIHLRQKQHRLADEFGPGTARALEEAVNDDRKFFDPRSDAPGATQPPPA
jgi:hypothetical protein